MQPHSQESEESSTATEANSTAAGDKKSSIGVYTPYTAKAMGTVEMYYSDASTDPKYRSHLMGYEVWKIIIPTKSHGLTAIVDGTV